MRPGHKNLLYQQGVLLRPGTRRPLADGFFQEGVPSRTTRRMSSLYAWQEGGSPGRRARGHSLEDWQENVLLRPGIRVSFADL